MELRATRISVARGGRMLLDGVDATFRPGRITAVLGPNGAGKSTLVKAMAGLMPVSAGQVTLGAEPLAMLDPRARARRIGYLPQQASVHWNLSVREVVALGRMPHHGPYAAASAADRAAVDRALEQTDTAGLAARPVLSLSGGERARVLLARVLAGEPEWLIADEPLASLDPAYQIDVLTRLRSAAGQGTGVVLVIHDLNLALRTADEAILLDGGRVVAAGSVETVLTAPLITQTYGVAIETGRTRDGLPYLLPSTRL